MRGNAGERLSSAAERHRVIIQNGAIFQDRDAFERRKRDDVDARMRRRLADGEHGFGAIDSQRGNGLSVAGAARVDRLLSRLRVAEFDVTTADESHSGSVYEEYFTSAVTLHPGSFEIRHNGWMDAQMDGDSL